MVFFSVIDGSGKTDSKKGFFFFFLKKEKPFLIAHLNICEGKDNNGTSHHNI